MNASSSPRLEDFDGIVEVVTGPGLRPWPVLAVEAYLRARTELAPDIHVVGPSTWGGFPYDPEAVRSLLCGVSFHGIKPLARNAGVPGKGMVASYAAFDPQTRALLGANTPNALAIAYRLLLRRGTDGIAPVVPIEGALEKQLSALVRKKAKAKANAKAKPAKK